MSLILFNCSCSLCIVVWAANLPALVLIWVLLLFEFRGRLCFHRSVLATFCFLCICSFSFCLPFMRPLISKFWRFVQWLGSFESSAFPCFFFLALLDYFHVVCNDTATYMLMTSGPCTHVVIKQLYVVSIAYNNPMQSGALQQQFINLLKRPSLFHSNRTTYELLSTFFCV